MKFVHCLLGMVLLGFSVASNADDIEIYLNADDPNTPSYVYLMLALEYDPDGLSAFQCTFDDDCIERPALPATCPDGKTCLTPETYANLDADFDSGAALSRFDVFIAILQTIFQKEVFQGIYVSIALMQAEGGGGDNGGATFLEGYQRVGDAGQDMIDTMKAIPICSSANCAHKVQPKETYAEWMRYLDGGKVINGTDNNGNYAGLPGPTYDTSIVTGAGANEAYISPFTAGECPKLFSIVVGTNSSQQDNSADGDIESDLGVSWKKNFSFASPFWRHLHKTSTDLVSHVAGNQYLEKSWTVSASNPPGSGKYLAEIKDWGKEGNGGILDLTDPEKLEGDLTTAFTEALSVSSTFVAASVPVNVFNQAESLDNLFIALFEAQSTIHWPGNIKKLKLVDNYDLNDPNNPDGRDGIFDDIVDVNGNPGFETTGSNRGRIKFNALTFWTDPGALPIPDPNGPDDPNNAEFVPDGVDGRVVPRGGSGQIIRGFVDLVDSPAKDGVTYTIGDINSSTTRKVYVTPDPNNITNGSANSFLAFDATTSMASELMPWFGVSDPNEALELIKWGRGQDRADEDKDLVFDEPRPWILADAIHSRPFALNYGDTDGAGGYDPNNPNIRLFYGTGDGLFHIVENTNSSRGETGLEVFAFYPRELLPNLDLRKTNSLSSGDMRYGIDSATVAYTNDKDDDGNLEASEGDEVYVYFGLRRGGSSYYALDVSDPSAAPSLKWFITNDGTGDFTEMGLTFSEPVVGKVRFGDTPTDVLIFGGGYHGGWDPNDPSVQMGKDVNDDDDPVGNAIYIVDARDGSLIWKAVEGGSGATNTIYQHSDLVDSIPSNITVQKNTAGEIHRMYVGDTGGAVWRVDVPPGNVANHRRDNWFISKFAELGTDGTTTDRRFFHAPDLVETFDDNGDLDGVLIGSGNRAAPNEKDVSNYFYYLKDRATVSGLASVETRAAITHAELPDQTSCIDPNDPGCNDDLSKGWKIAMNYGSGEKSLSTPLVDFGRVFFTSFVPSTPGLCGEPNEGTGYVYVVRLRDGTADANNQRIYDLGPGIPPGAILIGDVILLPGGGVDIYDMDGDGERDKTKLPLSLAKKLIPIYWRESGIDD